MNITIQTDNADGTFRLGESLGRYLRPGTRLLLDGDLAAGKTLFAKGVGAGLGIKGHIKSPSYTLLCVYEGRLPFYHFDAYNLNGMDDFYDLGFDEYLDCGGVALIEWASVIAEDFPVPYLHINISKADDICFNDESENRRTLTFSAEDAFHQSVLKEWLERENIGI